MIEAVIFDMDGLLIDSEPLWQEAEVALFNRIGVPLTPAMSAETIGLRVDEVIDYWYKRYPWETPSKQEVIDDLGAAGVALAATEGIAKEGVQNAIEICSAAGLPMAIASSSSMKMIQTVVKTLGIGEHIKVLHSAHDEDYGKPHPAVYLSTAVSLGVHPNHCLAFEDSPNGVISAKAAKMKCIAIPEPEMRDDKRFGIADIILDSLVDFTPDMLKDL